MFFVFGTSGQVFRGSLEQLRQVKGVTALDRTRRVQAVGAQAEDVALPHSSAAESESRAQAALSAYASTQHPVQRQPLVRVAQVMSHDVLTLNDDATVAQGWQLLSQRGVGQAPVVDGDGRLVGLFTRADLLQPANLPGASASGVAWVAMLNSPLTRLMRTPVPGVEPSTDIRRVAQVLLELNLPGLPVVDELGQVQGFVSRSDILRAVATEPPLDLWG